MGGVGEGPLWGERGCCRKLLVALLAALGLPVCGPELLPQPGRTGGRGDVKGPEIWADKPGV